MPLPMSLYNRSNIPNHKAVDSLLSIAFDKNRWIAASEQCDNKEWSLKKRETISDVYLTYILSNDGKKQAWDLISDHIWYYSTPKYADGSSMIRDVGLNICEGLICLIAFNDCAYMLQSDPGELKLLAALGDVKANMLLPSCIALYNR